MKWAADALMVGGGVVLSVGAGMVYVPAGVMLFGVLLLAGGILRARAGAETG